MGRLIDADLLKDNIIKCLKPLDPEEEMIDVNVALVSTLMEIDGQPTAYDVDKVVEQLEKLLEDNTSDSGDDWYTAECLNRAIKIVKDGGIK